MTRIKGIIIVALGLLFFAAYSWPADTLPRGPKAHLVENLFEFKPVLEGTEVNHAFVLRNQGDAPLFILKIEAG